MIPLTASFLVARWSIPGYVELLSNLLCTLRRLDLLPHVVGIALDEEALAECPGMGVECVLPAAPFLRAASASFHYHGNDDFKSLSKLKSRNVLEVLLRGYNVLLVDGDIVFFRNPLPTLRNGSRDFDLQIQSDSPHGRPKNAYLVRPRAKQSSEPPRPTPTGLAACRTRGCTTW